LIHPVYIGRYEITNLGACATAQPIRLIARSRVGQTLRAARRRAPVAAADRKLDAVRRAVRHDFPTADIDDMLEQIEQGYSARTKP